MTTLRLVYCMRSSFMTETNRLFLCAFVILKWRNIYIDMRLTWPPNNCHVRKFAYFMLCVIHPQIISVRISSCHKWPTAAWICRNWPKPPKRNYIQYVSSCVGKVFHYIHAGLHHPLGAIATVPIKIRDLQIFQINIACR